MNITSKKTLPILLILITLLACQTSSSANLIQTAVSGTQTAQVTLPPASVQTTNVVTQEVPTMENPLPNLTAAADPPAQSDPSISQGAIAQEVDCNQRLVAIVRQPPEMTKDLFEHHAVGTFLIPLLELRNLTDAPIQVWDGDYVLEGMVAGEKTRLLPQRAATGYLFITRGNNLSQDKIQPGQTWKTYLAFDVPPEGNQWELVVAPGKEGGQPLCEIRIRLTP